MNKILLSAAAGLLLIADSAFGQGLKIMPGATFKATGDISVVSESGNIVNNGNGDLASASIYFKGAGINTFGGTGSLSVKNFITAKAKGKTVLQNSISVSGLVT